MRKVKCWRANVPLRYGKLPPIIHTHIWDLCREHVRGYAQYGQVRLIYVYIHTKVWRATSGRRTPRLVANGGGRRTGGRRATNEHASVTQNRSGPPSCFTHVSITTPVVSALKNYYDVSKAF
jgi:hypothetical protein